jgi:hypothetical protein
MRPSAAGIVERRPSTAGGRACNADRTSGSVTERSMPCGSTVMPLPTTWSCGAGAGFRSGPAAAPATCRGRSSVGVGEARD